MSKAFEQYKALTTTSRGHRYFMLRWDWWFDKTTTGELRMKRVTAEAEAHFPKELRKIYQEKGPVAFIAYLQNNSSKGTSLAAAWAEAKRLFNEKPGIVK